MEILGYIALFFVGLLLGMLGGGGSILSVPILVYLFAVDVVMASAYSLFIVGTTSLVGTLLKSHTQMVDLRTAVTFGGPSLMAIFSTRTWIIPALPDVLFQTESFQLSQRAFILGLFALLMILASLSLIIRKDSTESTGKRPHCVFLMLVGVLIGFLSGLVGAGGGFLIVPALVYLARLPFKATVGTTLLIITINSFIGFAGDVISQEVNWYFLLSITVLAIFGIVVGAYSARSLPTQKLQKSFGWLILIMGTWILLLEL